MRKYIRAGKMIVNQKPNIIKRDHLSHKPKSFVAKDKLSKNNYYNKQTPLMRESANSSFKGVSFKGISADKLKKSFALYNEHKYNLVDSLKMLEKYIGKAPVELEANTSEWREIAQHIVKAQNDSTVVIKEKNWTKQLLDAMAAPITEIPFRIFKSLKTSFSGKNAAKTAQQTVDSANRNFLKKKLNSLDNADIVNSFIGYMESAQKYKHDSDKVRSAGLMSNALKMFDPKSGNYNAVHERALTRIVTGFIPAYFLANDAYNLSRLCDDDPQKADKERKLRFNQETKRVLSNAYLQLITLGALSKWINKSKATFVGVTALSVLITEAFSRLSNGKKIHMISKEEAIEMNKKEGLLPADYQPPADNKTDDKTAAYIPTFKGSKVFRSFAMADMPLAQMSSVNMSGKSIDEKLKAVNESKPLLTFSSLAKWFVGTIALGFALKSAKGLKVAKNIKINDYFKVLSSKYDKAFNSLTTVDYKISKHDYNKVINKLKEYDEVVGSYFERVIQNQQKTNKVNSISKEFSLVLKDAGLEDYAKSFEHISNLKQNNSFRNIGVYNDAAAFISSRDKKVIADNLNELFETMKANNLEEQANQIKSLILDNNGNIIGKNYTKAKKLINDIAKDYAFTFENRFKVDSGAENLKLFEKAISALRKINPQEAQRFADTVENSVNADMLSLGRKRIPIVKEVADFIAEPFKFIWGTITLPYKHIAKPISKLIKPDVKLPQWPKETEMVAQAVKRMTKDPIIKLPPMFGPHQGIAKIDYNKEDFAKYMNLQFNKGFNTATMSSLSNSDLSALAKNTSTAATAWFLMTDNHNMVMQKSNGENKKGAVLKAKERAVQETSRQFYNVMFISLFNNTFRNLYNSSLFGAQAVNTASTLVGEYVNRKAIGMSVTPQTRDEILENEYNNVTRKGLLGDFFRFMSRLTGKKVLSQRTPQAQTQIQTIAQTQVPNKEQAIKK